MASAYNPFLDWEALGFRANHVKDGLEATEENEGFFLGIDTLDPAMDIDLAGLDAACQNDRSDSMSSVNTVPDTATWAPVEAPIDELAVDGSLGAEYIWQQQLGASTLQISNQLQNQQLRREMMARAQTTDDSLVEIINEESTPSPRPARPRIVRRQNHACDACRAAKKACDLPPRRLTQGRNNAAKRICSLCTTRGTECTVSWLENKPPNKRARQQSTAQTPSNTAIVPINNNSAATMTLENDIARQIVARDTREVQFNFYVDSFEMPVAHCLLRGSMPPIYKLGLEAVTDLANMASMRQYVERAESSVRMCGEASSDSPWTGSMDAAPHLFRAVSVLDAIFETVLFPRIPKAKQASITETYRQVALATASQYTVKGPAAKPDEPSRGHDMSLATFRKARDLTFSNISTVGSFRLSFAMLLLGTVAPPGCGEELDGFLQDTRYLFQKGQRRLQSLCARATVALQALSASASGYREQPINAPSGLSLPSESIPLVSELVGVLQWFVDLCHSVVLSTSQPQELIRSNSVGSLTADSPASTESLSGTGTSSEPSPPGLAVVPLAPMPPEVEDSIVALAKSSTTSLLGQWKHGTAHDDATFISSARQVVAVAVLLWKSLGRLSSAVQGVLNDHTLSPCTTTVEPLYLGMSTLVRLWRGNFGTFDTKVNPLPDDPSPIVWRLLSLCSNDSDLAILLFCSLAKTLLQHIEESPESMGLRDTNLYHRLREDAAFIKEQRLVSAKQTCIVAQVAHAALDKSGSSPRARSLCLLAMNTVSLFHASAIKPSLTMISVARPDSASVYAGCQSTC